MAKWYLRMVIKTISIISLSPKYVKSIQIFNNNLIVVDINGTDIITVANISKHSRYTYTNMLLDIWITDIRKFNTFFEITYKITFHRKNLTVYFRSTLNILLPYCQSLTPIYPSASWLERECWDLFGIFFTNHIDLRRILTDYGFDGHPSRKDFPLSGYTEIGYSEKAKRVIIKPLHLVQEYRLLDFKTPWESII